MKRRNGFVSNSSSSSFVVVFDKRIEAYSDDDLKQKLFGTTEKVIKHKWYGDMDTDALLERVREEAVEITFTLDGSFLIPVDDSRDIVVIFNQDWNEACEKADALGLSNKDSFDEYWTKVTEIAEEQAKRDMLEFSKQNSGEYYHFSFADGNGDIESFLEHEYIFNKFPHVTQNNH